MDSETRTKLQTMAAEMEGTFYSSINVNDQFVIGLNAVRRWQAQLEKLLAEPEPIPEPVPPPDLIIPPAPPIVPETRITESGEPRTAHHVGERVLEVGTAA